MKKDCLNREFYKRIGINGLILYSIYLAAKGKESCAFEMIVKECFSLFPKVFNFQLIKKWPDSRKIDRPLRILRKRKLIEGDPKAGFSLTKSGKEAAESIAVILGQRRLQI